MEAQAQQQPQERALWKTIFIWTLVGLLIVTLLIGGIFYIVIGFIKNSGAYQTATQAIMSNDIFKEDYGSMTFGWLPVGQVQTTLGGGQASLQISIDGSQADGVAVIDLAQGSDGIRNILYLSSIIQGAQEKILINKLK